MARIAHVFGVTVALALVWFMAGANQVGKLVAGPLTSCVGDCRGDDQVTIDELVAMVNLALNGGVTGCSAGDSNTDGRITIDEILVAVNNALSGCPSGPTPTPTVAPSSAGSVQVTTVIFNDFLPQIGSTLPSVDTFVSTAITQGLNPFLENLVAADPSTREKIPNGVRLNFGSGTTRPYGTMAGTLTATYSNVTTIGNSISFDGVVNTENLTLNGVGYPINNFNVTVNATQAAGGTSTSTITLTGSGTNPPATTSGTILLDTARCPNYPIGGMITTTIGGKTVTIRFNDRCNGTFGFSGAGFEDARVYLTYYNCQFENTYSGTYFLVVENGVLGDDLSDDEPPNVSFSGTVSDTAVNMHWELKCKTAGCQRTVRQDGTFVGHLWKAEEHTVGIHYEMRYFVGSMTSHFAKYNDDGSLDCEETRVFDEQDGMNGIYGYYEFWHRRLLD